MDTRNIQWRVTTSFVIFQFRDVVGLHAAIFFFFETIRKFNMKYYI